MPKKAKQLTGDPNDKSKEPTSVTIPRDLLKWGRDYAEEENRNFSSLVVSLLKKEKKEVEQRSGPPPDATLKIKPKKK